MTGNISSAAPLLTLTFMESATKHHILSLSLVIMMMFAIFGNSMLFISVYRKRALRTRTNIFILNLAFADLGVALFCMPFSVVTCSRQEWVFGESLCQFNGFINILFAMSSLLTLTAISVEKYFAIVKPLYRIITNKRALLMLMVTWLGALFIALLPLTGFTRYEYKYGTTQCSVKSPSSAKQSIHAAFVFFFAYLVPLSIMGFAYVNIFNAARNHNRRMSRVSITSGMRPPSSAQKQIAFTVFIMLVVCLMCWTPYFIYVIMLTSDHKAINRTAVRDLGIAAYWCAFLNSTLDPYIYGLRNPQFKAAFKDLFVSIWRAMNGCCVQETESVVSGNTSWEISISDSAFSPADLGAGYGGKTDLENDSDRSGRFQSDKDLHVWFSDNSAIVMPSTLSDPAADWNTNSFSHRSETSMEVNQNSRIQWEFYLDCDFRETKYNFGDLKAPKFTRNEKTCCSMSILSDESGMRRQEKDPERRPTRRRRYGVVHHLHLTPLDYDISWILKQNKNFKEKPGINNDDGLADTSREFSFSSHAFRRSEARLNYENKNEQLTKWRSTSSLSTIVTMNKKNTSQKGKKRQTKDKGKRSTRGDDGRCLHVTAGSTSTQKPRDTPPFNLYVQRETRTKCPVCHGWSRKCKAVFLIFSSR